MAFGLVTRLSLKSFCGHLHNNATIEMCTNEKVYIYYLSFEEVIQRSTLTLFL
jgi:hypothetical protein